MLGIVILGVEMVAGVVIMLHSIIVGISEGFDQETILSTQRSFLFVNPYDIPDQLNPVTWDIMMWQNRIGVMLAGLLLLFFAIPGMDTRERLLK